VIADRRINTTDILPSTYSTRENGLQRYSGSALFARSRETSDGPTKTFRKNAKTPWVTTKL
jgi:hypothetical protein